MAGYSSVPTNMIELLDMRAEQYGDEDKTFFLNTSLDIEDKLSYHSLMIKSKAIAAIIQRHTNKGDRVLLVYPPGLEFICAFYGCLYAGVIAVPVYPPVDKKLVDKLQAVIKNSEPKIILSTKTVVDQIEKLKYVKALQNINFVNYLLNYFKNTQELTQWDFDKFFWINTNKLNLATAKEYQKVQVEPNEIAFLQYTSGSTGQPKGVMISHSNLLHNFKLINQFYPATPESRLVIWLPPYHDMGLIGGILYPIFSECQVYIMSPMTFLRNPISWLRALDRYQGTVTSAPNFAYALCNRKISEKQLATINLSSVQSFLNGAEPISNKIAEEFCIKFKPCGFKREMFLPCYGLAEGTLMVTGIQDLKARYYSKVALRSNRLVPMAKEDKDACSLVSCGIKDDNLAIVDLTTFNECNDGEIGEIWISGPSVAQGYWNQPELTNSCFDATIANRPDKKYLRTGDLGFICDQNLYVMGRNKDLIIVNGTNHYPQDIEYSIEQSHPAIRRGGSAAVSIVNEEQEQLVIIAEIDKNCSEEVLHEIVSAINEVTLQDHSLPVYKIALIQPRQLPKTTSGKIRRSTAKALLLDEEMPLEFLWTREYQPHTTPAKNDNVFDEQATPSKTTPSPLGQDLRIQISNELGDILSINPENIDPDKHFGELGLDSLMAIELESRLQNYLKKTCKIEEIAVINYPTVNSLMDHIEQQITRATQKFNTKVAQPFEFIDIDPERNTKPREKGLTSLLDTGLGLMATEQLIAMAGDYIDIVKLGFGTARLYPEGIVREKIELLKKANIHVCPGGTFFEIARLQNKVDLYFQECLRLGFNCIELSDGVAGIPLDEKIRLIQEAKSLGFVILSEVGRKDPEQDRALSVTDRVREIKEQIAAGAWKIILEARESGNVGIFNGDTSINSADFDSIINEITVSDLIFEAPLKHQQAWLIKQLGCSVNIGNILPNDVIALEALRVGLRADTVVIKKSDE